mmetsp:Transcript_5090/g.19155  ORF Transcript_5090/g.19155 Transcript_5090/m.19155 type:complete len:203 (-) Transcript_5090:266-874(-)
MRVPALAPDLGEEVPEGAVRLLPDLPVGIAEHVQQPVQYVRQVREHVNLRHRVQRRDPAHQKLPHVRVQHPDALPQHRRELRDVERLDGLRDDILHEPVQQVRGVLNVRIVIRRQFAQRVEDVGKVRDECDPRRLGYVVQRLARVVPDALVGVREALEHRRDYVVEFGVRGAGEGDGDGGEADEPPFLVVRHRQRHEIVHQG